jgi:hypothetical protein
MLPRSCGIAHCQCLPHHRDKAEAEFYRILTRVVSNTNRGVACVARHLFERRVAHVAHGPRGDVATATQDPGKFSGERIHGATS